MINASLFYAKPHEFMGAPAGGVGLELVSALPALSRRSLKIRRHRCVGAEGG